ncbi:MAG: hypothetical protein KAQ74_00230 [Dehalococcoidia bacterium]|nr:hypothetical protein [Dehalococcoidia bacterium]
MPPFRQPSVWHGGVGVSKFDIVIVGGGTAGEYAAGTALALGKSVAIPSQLRGVAKSHLLRPGGRQRRTDRGAGQKRRT